VSDGLDPAPIDALRDRTRAAIAELRALRCHDAAAADALAAAKLTVHTLESWWLPALDHLAATGRRAGGGPGATA
jgi:hypothetical protein